LDSPAAILKGGRSGPVIIPNQPDASLLLRAVRYTDPDLKMPPKGKKLPPILPKESLWAENAQFPYQTHAYELAAKIPNVIHQQPCYCYCDRGMGHNSLHSCFENTHGAQCDVCLKELYYSYSQTKKGKTPAQIRQGITKGEWKQVDLQTAADIN
jgi:hypothetical protein